MAVGHINDLANRIDRAKSVRNVRDADELRFRPEQLREFLEDQLAAVVDRNHSQLRAAVFAEKLPGHDIRMVLHVGDDHFIARMNLRAAVGLRDEVDALRGAAHEDDFGWARGVDEFLHGRARRFVFLGRLFGKMVDGAVNIGVGALVIPGNRVDHGARLLRRGSVVEIDEWLAVDLLLPGSGNRHGRARRRKRRIRAWRRCSYELLLGLGGMDDPS